MPSDEQTVLVVDDDQLVRRLATSSLQRSGFLVYGSQSGERGYSCFTEHPDEIDLVLTDIAMPLMSGPQMVDQILRLRPEIKVLFMTGYDANHILPEHQARRFRVLAKPFTSNTLVSAVRKCLAER